VLLLWRLTFEKRIVLQVAAFALGLFAAATVPAGVLHSQSKTGIALETPSGNIVIAASPDDARTQKYLWLKAHTHPGDFFLTPDHLEYDYLFHLNHPGPVPYLSIYDYTTPPQ